MFFSDNRLQRVVGGGGVELKFSFHADKEGNRERVHLHSLAGLSTTLYVSNADSCIQGIRLPNAGEP